MEVLRRPKGFDHQEGSVSVFEEPAKLAIARIEAPHEAALRLSRQVLRGRAPLSKEL